jgi:hypothetical protein
MGAWWGWGFVADSSDHRGTRIRHREAIPHGIKAVPWAATCLWLSAIDSYREAILYSVDSFAKRGTSGLSLDAQWRLMGALEAANGMLLLYQRSLMMTHALPRLSWPGVARPPTSFGRHRRGRRGLPGHARP